MAHTASRWKKTWAHWSSATPRMMPKTIHEWKECCASQCGLCVEEG